MGGSSSTLGSMRSGGLARSSLLVRCMVHLFMKWSERHMSRKLVMSMCASAWKSSLLCGMCMLSMREFIRSVHLVYMRCLP